MVLGPCQAGSQSCASRVCYGRTVQGKLGKTLIDEERISVRVSELARAISADLERISASPEETRIVLIPIMTGAMVFASDLIRRMPVKLRLGLVAVSSYVGKSMASRGAMIRGELPRDLAGQHVLIVDDILDSGQTLSLVRELVLAQNPASVRVCVLLRKPEEARVSHVHADYVGFDIPNVFVVGYGLDHDGHFRNLPAIAELAGVEP